MCVCGRRTGNDTQKLHGCALGESEQAWSDSMEEGLKYCEKVHGSEKGGEKRGERVVEECAVGD